MKTLIAVLLLTVPASAADLLPLAAVPLPPLPIAAVPLPAGTTPVCTHCEGTPTGYVWHYSNGTTLVEEYADYVARGKAPTLTCSTGHCSKASAGPVKPTGGCRCGCNAATCNCAHSPNVGRQPVAKEVAGPVSAYTDNTPPVLSNPSPMMQLFRSNCANCQRGW